MPVQGTDYIGSNGKLTAVSDMPYPYLVNALNKAQSQGDDETVRVLSAELNSRPQQ